MEIKKKALGKGLEQLFANNVIDFDNFENSIMETEKGSVTEVLLSEIRSNPYQPRKHFDDVALQELADSIKEYGIVQPVILKKSIKGYELIAGERRCKAAKIAGLAKVPAVIKEFSDQEMMEIALLENIQREDLNPIEVAESINSIIKLKNFTQEEFALKFGKSRSYVTNLLGLLKLPETVKKMVESKKISMSHARLLSKLSDDEKIISLAQKVIKEDLSVHSLEKLLAENVENKKILLKKFDGYNIYAKLISDKFNEKVNISKNKIEIRFENEEDLIRLLNLMNVKVDEE